ncbi:MAG: hypothetical protein HGA61_03120 [Candidatus Moranbacteria bacterium]|nr:hypothetical protein [Candidatus Moranbacteria bacterium]
MARLFALLWAAGTEELQRLRFLLISVSGATLIGAILILAFRPSVGVCLWIVLVPWLFTAYRLFSIERLVQVHLAGESLEILSTLRALLNRQNVNPLENELTKFYLLVISGAFFFQTALFLMLPLYVNFTEGGITAVLLIIMLAVVVGIASASFLATIFRGFVFATVALYCVGLLFVLFPQVQFYLTGITGKVEVVAPSTAKLANELSSLQSEQQEEIDNNFVKGVIAWQKAHPGERLPKEYQAAFDRARQLGKLK